MITLLWLLDALAPLAYVFLLAGSSLMAAWGNAGEYTMLSELGGADGRLAVNSLATAQVSFAVIVGPALAGGLIAVIGPGWLVALDAASFAFLGIQAWRTHTGESRAARRHGRRGVGFRLPRRRRDLLVLTAVTWVLFFLYGPVEAALPVYVADDLRAGALLLGAYWTAFGVGALAATLIVGRFRGHNVRRITLSIVAGWGMCLIPFGFAPVGVTVLGGPLVGALGASATLAASGLTTVALAVVATMLWTRSRAVAISGDRTRGTGGRR